MPTRTIGGIPLRSTSESFSPFSRIAALIWAQTKLGKTTLIGTADDLCQKYMNGKRALVIACDEGDGAGTQVIRDKGIPLTEPKSLSEFKSVLAALPLEKEFGAVILDDGTSFTEKYVKKSALEQPMKKASEQEQKLRTMGVPAQGDYQTIGEFTRDFVTNFIRLSTFGHPEQTPEQCALRKHVFMTAQERVKTDRDGEKILYTGPAFPGSAPTMVASIFPLVCTITNVRDSSGTVSRMVKTSSDNSTDLLGDRSKLFPRFIPMDICRWYEEYWLPEIEKVRV